MPVHTNASITKKSDISIKTLSGQIFQISQPIPGIDSNAFIRTPILISRQRLLFYGAHFTDIEINESRAFAFVTNKEGILDTKFGQNGILYFDEKSRDIFSSATEDENGNIFLGGLSNDWIYETGETGNVNSIPSNIETFIIKINQDGKKIESFGDSGIARSFPQALKNFAFASAMTSFNGAIYIAGAELLNDGGRNFTLISVSAKSGLISNTFGDNGIALASGEKMSLAFQLVVRKNQIFAFGDSYLYPLAGTGCVPSQVVLRWSIINFDLHGNLRNEMSNNSCFDKFSAGFKEGIYNQVYFKGDDFYLSGGVLKTLSPNSYDSKIMKININGTVDNNYTKYLNAIIGMPPFNIPDISYSLSTQTMDSNGYLYLGFRTDSEETSVIRINKKGNPDLSFGIDGKLVIEASGNLVTLPNNRIALFSLKNGNLTVFSF